MAKREATAKTLSGTGRATCRIEWSTLGPVYRAPIALPPDFPAYGDLKQRYRNLHGGTDLPGPHVHNAFEIGVIHKGRGAFLIGSRLTAFSAGDIFFIDGSIPHVAFYAAPCVCSWMYLDLRTMFGPMNPGARTIKPEVLSSEFSKNAFSSRKYPDLAELIDEIVDEFGRKRPCYQDAIRGRLLAVLALLERLRITGDRHFSERSMRAQTPAEKSMGMAIDFMNVHYDEKIGNTEIAQAACMSVTHFRHEFRRILGMPPHVYLTTLRLRAACEALRNGRDKIDTIANECGFEDVSSFRRAFKRVLKVSPAVWKRTASRESAAQ